MQFISKSFLFAEKRLEFEKRRKAHYNEFEAIKLARKLIEEDDEEDEDDDDEGETSKSAENAQNEKSS